MWREEPGRNQDAIGSQALCLDGPAVHPAGACQLHTAPQGVAAGDHIPRRLSSNEQVWGQNLQRSPGLPWEQSNFSQVAWPSRPLSPHL